MDHVVDAASPFHAGEQQVQARLGVRSIEQWARKVIRPFMPAQHRAFHTSLPFIFVAARDARSRPWVTLLAGPLGFVTSPDARTLVIDARPAAGDALADALHDGVDIGLLGIDFPTRRRNRLNGRVARNDGGAMVCRVEQTFGNCPQYIHERGWRRVEAAPGRPVRSRALSSRQREWIASADTFFVASGYRGKGENPAFGMDASHRGGSAGFVRVESGTRLVFPDYAGNNHFNTLGNLVLDPGIGLTFVDFATGSLLQLTGRATIDWDPGGAAADAGARRLIHVDIDQIVELRHTVPLRWEAGEQGVRELRLIEKVRESDDVTSFVFESRDGGPLALFRAGQHVEIEIDVPGVDLPLLRTYSLSGPGGRERYRISVKRHARGIASRRLHDHFEPGAILSARRPAGDFVIGCGNCPVVLVSAGVGVTPMTSMLHALAEQPGERPVWFVHGARDGRHHPFAKETRQLVAGRANIQVHVAYSRPLPGDRGHDSVGHVDGRLLARLVDAPDAHYFVCGPDGFMAGLADDLGRRGVPNAHVHVESFGSAA
jgi:ferredoxin-NADP reductase/predicted pyridoxine 5'-phosphate oxidase superfamily flavin-nucleotide-binding protein